MNTTKSVLLVICVAWLVIVTATGCAIVNLPPNPAADDISSERQKRTEEVVDRFDKSRDFAQFEAASGQWKRGDVKGCKESLRRLLARNPAHRDARLLMIELCLASKNPEQAAPHAEHLLAAWPNDAQVQYTNGLVLDTLGRETEALVHYQKAAELEPGNEVYTISHQTAGQSVADSADRNSDHTSAHSVRVLSPPGRGDQVESIDLAVQLDPAAPDRLLNKADEALKVGSGELALAYIRKAVAVRPDNPQIPVSAAVLALRHNQPDIAVAVAEDALRLFPNSAVLHRTLGTGYYRQGDYRSSQVVLQQALSLDKSSALSYFLVGLTLVKLGQSDAAEANFRQARRIDPRYTIQR